MVDRLSQYEEVFHQAYTHGLEAIYTLQAVDLSSIRRVSTAPLPVPEKKAFAKADLQLTFDFGVPFRDWIKPLWSDEPIRVLGLSANAQRGLVTLRKACLGELVGLDFRQPTLGKTLGQGHIDEIQQKLHSYISEQDRERTYRLDIASWARGLCGELETKRAYLFCERFGLNGCCPISVGELGELKRASSDMRLRWIEEASQQLQKSALLTTWREIVSAFLIPWMHQRQGLATYNQLTERLQQVSIQQGLVGPVLKLLAELLQCSSPFSTSLHMVEESVFCADSQSLRLYREVLNIARSYFCEACPQYSYSHLVRLVAQEAAKRWEAVDDAFIDRCLRLSNYFVVRKLPQMGLAVRLF